MPPLHEPRRRCRSAGYGRRTWPGSGQATRRAPKGGQRHSEKKGSRASAALTCVTSVSTEERESQAGCFTGMTDKQVGARQPGRGDGRSWQGAVPG